MFFLNVRGLLVTYTKTGQSLTSTQHSRSVLTTYTTKFIIGDIERECCYAYEMIRIVTYSQETKFHTHTKQLKM
jgi:hypothetical protein